MLDKWKCVNTLHVEQILYIYSLTQLIVSTVNNSAFSHFVTLWVKLVFHFQTRITDNVTSSADTLPISKATENSQDSSNQTILVRNFFANHVILPMSPRKLVLGVAGLMNHQVHENIYWLPVQFLLSERPDYFLFLTEHATVLLSCNLVSLSLSCRRACSAARYFTTSTMPCCMA